MAESSVAPATAGEAAAGTTRLLGWPVVGWAAFLVIATAGSMLAVAGVTEAGLRLVIRATARTSALFFLLAFLASSLRVLHPSDATRWMLANRRQLGLSFAVSHLVHLLAVACLFSLVPGWAWRPLLAGFGGHLALVFAPTGVVALAALTATSFDTAAAWLGVRRWKRLHTFGVHFLWLEFTGAFGRRALHDPFYVPFVLVFVAALGVRLTAHGLASRDASSVP